MQLDELYKLQYLDQK